MELALLLVIRVAFCTAHLVSILERSRDLVICAPVLLEKIATPTDSMSLLFPACKGQQNE